MTIKTDIYVETWKNKDGEKRDVEDMNTDVGKEDAQMCVERNIGETMCENQNDLRRDVDIFRTHEKREERIQQVRRSGES